MSLEKQAVVRAGGMDFSLTAREKRVIVLVGFGYTNKDITKEFGVSKQTIDYLFAKIYDKLGVANRLELLLFALHHRLIDYAQMASQFQRTPRNSSARDPGPGQPRHGPASPGRPGSSRLVL